MLLSSCEIQASILIKVLIELGGLLLNCPFHLIAGSLSLPEIICRERLKKLIEKCMQGLSS